MNRAIVTVEKTEDTELWAEAYSRWLEAVQAKRGSIRTRREYEKSLKSFSSFAEGKHPARVSGADCQRWAATMTEQNLRPATIRARLAAVSSFYQFVATKFEAEPGRYLHNFNPVTAVTRPAVNPYANSQGLNPSQAAALLHSCNRSTVKGLRDYAILSFYLMTGRRRAEIVRLTWADLREGQESGQKEYHYRGKGNKTNWRDLPPPVWKALEAYLKAAGRLDSMKATSPLLTTTRAHQGDQEAQPLHERTINQLLDYACQRAGLAHIKVHTLRHTGAKLRRAAGADLESVSSFLDHSSIATTQIYLASLEGKRDYTWEKVAALLGA